MRILDVSIEAVRQVQEDSEKEQRRKERLAKLRSFQGLTIIRVEYDTGRYAWSDDVRFIFSDGRAIKVTIPDKEEWQDETFED